MAAGLYEELFTVIVSLINRYRSAPDVSCPSYMFGLKPEASVRTYNSSLKQSVSASCPRLDPFLRDRSTYGCFYACRALSGEQLALASVMVVDTPGLRNPRHAAEERGASWSELCHNYLQERLLEHYHAHTFVHTLDRYAQVTVHARSCS